MENSRTWKKVATFYSLTLLFSIPFYWAALKAGLWAGGFLYVIGLMWCPGVAALATKALFHEKISTLGWQWGSNRYVVWGYLLPIIYVLPVYVIVWLSGLGGVPNTEFITESKKTFGLAGTSDGMFLVIYVLLIATVGIVQYSGELGEEIGWRGFLVPELAKVVGFKWVALISGLMWAIWHYPILIFGSYNSGTPVWFGVTCFTVMVVAMSFILASLRLQSGSFWPAVFLHASHNAFIQRIFTPLTVNTGITAYVIDEFGVGLALSTIVVAIFVCRPMPKKLFQPAETLSQAGG
ncbi:hypothetical protein EG19_08705 [Thermoanaerobaculum aquaticum]|uniref:CAAX prenyl protease 2/Lysostaphin resistance protein A-like domain-containing protein n=1 Tax=Thermoanaerobaculum aquaticum TaxID=1312852 RepID=A0A062XK73_9BACT|nr:type II CAAX endopeptidase family protein [Thermoanaerobaculum aquaticum]KDA52907.1 hypothetical protein EG19_08705 [Thermoanaerobaculum aquaticum]